MLCQKVDCSYGNCPTRQFFFKPQDGHEGILGDFHTADHLHAAFALLLFLEQFLLAGDIAAVTLGQHVLAQRL